MKSEFRIRTARKDDAHRMFLIQKECHSPWTTEEIQQLIDCKDETCCYVATNIRGEVVGFATAHIGTDCISVIQICVAIMIRRQGIGTQLLRRLIGRCTGRRKFLSAVVEEHDDGAIDFLRRAEVTALMACVPHRAEGYCTIEFIFRPGLKKLECNSKKLSSPRDSDDQSTS